MAYLGKTPSQAVRSRYYYTATGGETSLSGADDNSNVLTFTDGNYVDVSLNGVALVAGTDYNTTTTNTIGGLTALVASDVVEVIVYDTFSVFGGNMAADLNFKDNVKANFGTGNDLQIFHDGSNSIIRDAGTGSLKFQYGTSDGVVFDSSGNVGIGGSPTQKLDVAAGGKLYLRRSDNATGATIHNGGSAVGLVFDELNNEPIAFKQNNTERMRIDSSGNLLVGTTSFNSNNVGVLAGATGAFFATRDGNTPAQFNRKTSDGSIVGFQKDGTTVGSIGANGGRVYTAGPSYGAKFGNVSLDPCTSTGATADNLYDLGGSSVRWKDLYLSGTLTNNGTGGISIDTSGNVGIGTSNPTAALTLGAGGVGRFYRSDNARYGEVFTDGTAFTLKTSTDPIILNPATGGTRFQNNGSEAARLDASGNLLVGKTSAATNVEGGELRENGQVIAVATNVNPFFGARLGSDGHLAVFRKDSTTVGIIGAYNSAIGVISGSAASYTGLYLNTDKIEPAGNNFGSEIRADNTVDIGSSSYRFKDLYLSGGVYLGGTGSANLLDDYEEGTFVPYVSLTYNPNGRTITDNGAGVGRYTKIGNIVTCEIKVGWTGISGSGSKNVGINNLPFTKATDITVVNGVARSNVTGHLFVMESVTGTQVNVIRKYDNGSPNDVDTFNCFIVYRTT